MSKQPENCFVCRHRVNAVCVCYTRNIVDGHDVCKDFVQTLAVDSYSSVYVAMQRVQNNHA